MGADGRLAHWDDMVLYYADIAPTLAFLAGVEMADTERRVLTEGLVR